MKKSEIKVGGHYTAKVSGRVVTVRVDAIREGGFTKGGSQTAYDVTNRVTGRKTTFRSAAKFRAPAEIKAKGTVHKGGPMDGEAKLAKVEAEQRPDPIQATPPADGTTAVTNVSCPRCGQTVAVTDGRYDYHRHSVKGITCGMSGEKVQGLNTPVGEVLASASSSRQLEGEQSADPTPATTPTPLTSGNAPTGLLSKLRSTPAAATPPHVVVTARAGTGKTFTIVVGVVNTFRDLVPGLWEELVQRLGFEPTPSDQQRAVWDQMRLSAGCKTVKFCAFNRSIVSDFEHKWAWVIAALKAVGIEFGFSTMHSMGLKAVTRAFGRLEVSEYVVQDLIAEILHTDLRQLRKENPTLLKATADLVSLCKMNLVDGGPYKDWQSKTTAEQNRGITDWGEELSRLASHYDVDLNNSRRQVFDMVPQVLDRCRDPKQQGRIDYDDMIWLPVALDLPVFKHDLLLVDEAQDLNRCQQALARKAGKRLVLVGDERQAIYGFAGADAESIPRMIRELDNDQFAQHIDGERAGKVGPGCVVLPLTVTRRCGKRIVEEARKFVPDFEAHESNPDGEVKDAKYPRYKDGQGVWQERPWEQTYGPAVREGDMVLCRTNAPLVSQCFRFLKRGIKANIQGRDVGQGLVTLVKKSNAERVPELLRWLEDWHDAERAKENAKKNPSEAKLTAVTDRYSCLLCFTEGAKLVVVPSGFGPEFSVETEAGLDGVATRLATFSNRAEAEAGKGKLEVQAVIAKIESVFTDDKQKPGVKFSSVHRAKGLESRRVFILYPPDSGPRTDRLQEWERQQESNLTYVAVTRAISELTYVS